ncbi:MAG: DUF3109 family protein [Prevotellaceae bacterium]|nr:DUF3109 family protein [Prevotellaceae bacterium]
MIQIDDKLVSAEVWRQCFVCDLTECAGICCVWGDSGAPLEADERDILQLEYPHFASYMTPEGIRAVEAQGVAMCDADGDLVTPLIEGKECAYAYFDAAGICYCAIERACREGKTAFRKPISCWLYPIRLARLSDHIGLNYDRAHLCRGAREKGEQEQMPVFRFLREPLVHRFGEAFYRELEQVAETLNINH